MRWGLASPTAAVTAGMVLSTAGCLTAFVMDKSSGGEQSYSWVEGIRGAAVRGEILYLQLETKERFHGTERTILWQVPIREIGSTLSRMPEMPPERKQQKVASHEAGCFEPATALPADANPLPINYLKVYGTLELRNHIATLPPGVHVLVTTFTPVQPTPDVQTRPSEEISLPPDSRVLLVAIEAGDQPHQQWLAGFKEIPEKRRAWLLLAPMTIAVDMVTFPLQIIGLLLLPEC